LKFFNYLNLNDNFHFVSFWQRKNNRWGIAEKSEIRNLKLSAGSGHGTGKTQG